MKLFIRVKDCHRDKRRNTPDAVLGRRAMRPGRTGKAGVEDKDVTVVFGLGSHRKQTEEEMKRLVGEDVYNRVKCIDSDPDDVEHMGYCKNGTPVDIFRTVADADRRILLGNVEYHYFAGYSGGMKAIMPGVSSRAAIQETTRT